MNRKHDERGQTLVLFALFLVVLLGVSALGIDYANWLLIDRSLQNTADHAALAGASVFGSETPTGSCGSGVGVQNCLDSRTKAWRSLSQDLNLGLSDAVISCLGGNTSGLGGDTPVGGWTNASQGGCGSASFQGQTIWVDTPPPNNAAYTNVGGSYALSYGIVFVRVDRPAQTYLAHVFGLNARKRTGWATAGVLPTDFALSVFCRNNISPENGVCAAGGDSIGIDGQGGITLDKGDIGSNESLQVTASSGAGVVMKSGNVFLVEGACGPSTWACPPATTGGITDGNGNPKNAFYIPPNPVPTYALPGGVLADPSSVNTTCTASSTCIPGSGASNATPIDWTCVTSGSTNRCGTPQITTVSGASQVTCASNGTATQDLRPNLDGTKSNWNGTQGGSNIYPNVADTNLDPSGSNPLTYAWTSAGSALSGAITDMAYSTDGADGATYVVYLNSANGTLQPNTVVDLRFVMGKVQKTGSTVSLDNAAGSDPVQVVAQLQQGGTPITGASSGTLTATATATAYQFQFNTNTYSITNANSLSIKFVVSTQHSGANSNKRGAAIMWAGVYLETAPVPPPPPMIPPGLYRSIVIPSGGCAVLDPTAYYSSGLQQYQEPGVYYFEDANGGGQKGTISLGDGSVLIGDGVTLVFDSNWSNPSGTGGASSAQGIKLGSNAALVLNSATSTYNPSYPLSSLPSDALSAAWAVDPTATTTGMSTWGGPCATTTPCVIARSSYAVTSNYRGITFYFKPKTNGASSSSGYSILGRFAMGGNVSGIDFKGIMYAPYDDVQISGANGFDTVGMVLAWTAKFNGGSASITLDYPYARIISPPYLLEPTVSH